MKINVKEMGSHWVLFLLYISAVLIWPEDVRSRPKHVVKYNLIVIIVSCLDVCCVLTVHNIYYKNLDIYTTEWLLSVKKNQNSQF